MICSNYVSVLHSFYDIPTCLAYITPRNLKE